MRARLALLLLLSSALLACNLLRKSSEPSLPSSEVFDGKARPSVLEVPPEKMLSALHNAYRLRPDARFLLAVQEVHQFMGPPPWGDLQLGFRDARWRIRCANSEVGEVPEFPDFKDFLNVLSGWIRRLNQAHPLGLAPGRQNADATMEQQLDGFFAPEAFSALREANRLWLQGERPPELLRVATRAMVLLALQSLDETESADIVPAKALALLALTKTLTPYPVTREECLLSQAMGYSQHAETLAATLPEPDPVRLYVQRNDPRLVESARQPDASAEVRYLCLRRIAEKGDFKNWQKSYGELFSARQPILSALGTGLLAKRFELNASLPEELMPLIFKESEQTSQGARAEAVVPVLGGVSQAYYQAYMYSSLYAAGIHGLYELSSLPAAKEFAALLARKGAKGFEEEFGRWYGHLVQSEEGNMDLQILVDDLGSLPHLGGPPLVCTFGELRKRASYGDPKLFVAARRLAARLDTRVSHRVALAGAAFRALMDLRLAETLYRSALDAAPAGLRSTQAWYARFSGDRELLKQLLHSADVEPSAKAEVLRRLEGLGEMNAEAIASEYRRLVSDAPDSWAACNNYADYLERHRQYAEARSGVQQWLARPGSSEVFENIYAHTTLARLYRYEKRYAEAWAAIAPVVKSQQGGAMAEASVILEVLGRMKEAEAMARAGVERYPDSLLARARLARFYWSRGRYEDAAQVLKESPHKINLAEWKEELGPKFAGVFLRKSQEETLAAFSALQASGFDPFSLDQIAESFGAAHRPETAFEMVSRLHAQGTGQLFYLLHGYRYLKQWRGAPTALAWVRKAIPPQFLPFSTMISFDEGQYELLWDLIGDPGKDEGGDFVWLLRAAASVKLGAGKDPHRAELLNHYDPGRRGWLQRIWYSVYSPPHSYYHTIGRYLLGLTTERKTLALATDPKKRCEIAYYIGLRAEGEGRYAEASDWFRVSSETGLANNGEYRWSYNTLYLWQKEGESLARLAAESKQQPSPGTS